MDWELATGGGLVGLVVFVSWALRQLLTKWLTDEAMTRIMPALVVVLSLVLTYATAETPLPLQGGIAQGLTVAAAAMAAYSGTKALVGKS